MIPETLITYIETAIIPRYKEFDKAHNLSHLRTVIEESLALARQYPEADERLAYVMPPTMTRDCAATAPPTTLSPARY